MKAGVALLGEFGTAQDFDLVATIGLYEEITFYSVMALLKLLRRPLFRPSGNWRKRPWLEANTRRELPRRFDDCDLVDDGLRSGDPSDFHLAAILASHVGIDAWPLRLDRQRRGPAREWYNLMQTDRRDRIEQVIELARCSSISTSLVRDRP